MFTLLSILDRQYYSSKLTRLSGLRFGMHQIKVTLTCSPRPKTPGFRVKNTLFNPRPLHTSVSLFAKRARETMAEMKERLRRLELELAEARKNERSKSAEYETKEQQKFLEQAVVGLNGYRFPIIAGENTKQWYSTQVTLWGGYPPFLDRHNALFALLCNAYSSVEGIMKPVVTIATTTGGFGKTRILVEWIAQVFNHPFLVTAFLESRTNLDDMDPVTTGIEEQIRGALNSGDEERVKRANFLLRLLDTGISASIITVHAEKNLEIKKLLRTSIATEKQVIQVCKAILITGITSRFSTQIALHKLELAALANYYLSLVRSTTVWPNFVTQERPKQMLVINIDEVQDFVKKRTYQENKNLAFEVARELLITLPKDSTIINMVGLRVGNLSALEDQAKFNVVPYLPMDALIHRRYLSEVCSKVLHKNLFSSNTTTSKEQYFSKALSLQLHDLWVTTGGIPRTIESLISELRIRLRNTTEKFSDKDMEAIRSSITKNRPFEQIIEQLGANFPKEQWSQLLLNFVFCVPERPDGIIGDVHYEDLEAAGFIIPFEFTHSNQATPDTDFGYRFYTIPFNLYSTEIRKAIPAFQGNYTQEINPHNIPREEHPITLEMVLKVYGRSVIDETASNAKTNELVFTGETNNNAGKILEEAAAASLWLRYLQKGGRENAIQPMVKILPSFPHSNYYASWRGVVKLSELGLCYKKLTKESLDLEKHPDFDKYVDFLAQNHYIAINTPTAQFANVIAPLYDKAGNFKKILCIQCRNVANTSSKIIPATVYPQMRYILSDNRAILMILSPNISEDLLSKQGSIPDQKSAFKQWEATKDYIISNGKNFLSDWFLRVFSESFLEMDEE